MVGVVAYTGLATVRHDIVAVCVTWAAAAEGTGAGVTDGSGVWVRPADIVATTAVDWVGLRVDAQWAAASKIIRTCATCAAITYALVVRAQLVLGTASIVYTSHARVRVKSAMGRWHGAIRVAITATRDRHAGFAN